MNLRLIGTSVAAAVAGGVFAWVLFTLVAGGGGGDDRNGDGDTAATPGNDPRMQRLITFIPLQVEKLGGGADLVYGVMDFRVQEKCSLERFIEVMADVPPPTAFRRIKDVIYNDDGTADVTIVLIKEGGDVEVSWKLSFLADGRPKILELPGSEECTPG